MRFTLRRLMLAVAIASAVLAASVEIGRLRRASAAYRQKAQEHAAIAETLKGIIAASGPSSPIDISPGEGLRSKRFTAKQVANHEARLAAKYERAARYPWLSVEPDPPEPR